MFDLLLALAAAVVLVLPVLVRLTPPRPALYWSDRVGRGNKLFKMPKFRSMRVGMAVVATYLLADPKSHLTPIGNFLRKSSLDELPQLCSILVGDMSFAVEKLDRKVEYELDEMCEDIWRWQSINPNGYL